MLEACDYAYATSGCSQVVRQFAKKGGCHVLKQYRQAALLEAIHHRLRSDGVVLSKSSIPSSRLHSGHFDTKVAGGRRSQAFYLGFALSLRLRAIALALRAGLRFAATFGRSNLLEFVDTLARNTPQIKAGPLLRFHWPANPQP